MELKNEQNSPLNTSGNCSKGKNFPDKKVENTEDLLCKVLTALGNDNCKNISKWFIMLDTPFTTTLHLDKVKSSKSKKIH